MIALHNSVKELTEVTRKARTMQWVFLQYAKEASTEIARAKDLSVSSSSSTELCAETDYPKPPSTAFLPNCADPGDSSAAAAATLNPGLAWSTGPY